MSHLQHVMKRSKYLYYCPNSLNCYFFIEATYYKVQVVSILNSYCYNQAQDRALRSNLLPMFRLC